MKVTLEPTDQVATIEGTSGVGVRIWRGQTESGTRVHAFIALIAARDGENVAELDAELVAKAPGSVTQQFDLGGKTVFADEARAQPAREVASTIMETARQAADAHGSGAVLDALASVYLDLVVALTGPTNAAAALDGLKAAIPTVAATHRAPGLGAAPVAGRA